jgi:hypothetical protein
VASLAKTTVQVDPEISITQDEASPVANSIQHRGVSHTEINPRRFICGIGVPAGSHISRNLGGAAVSLDEIETHPSRHSANRMGY